MTVKNFDTPILGLDGSTIKIVDDKAQLVLVNGQPKLLTIKDLVLNLLTATLEDDKHKTGAEKINLISLALRINEGGDREFTVDELSMIKDRANKAGVNHLHYFRLCEFIDKTGEQNG